MELGNLGAELEVWASFGEDGSVLVRHIPKDELLAISKKATKRRWSSHQMIEEVDPILANRLLGRAAVRDWKNLTMGGEPFPFTPENLDMLMDRSYQFSNWVNQVVTDVQTFLETRREESEKNS